MSSVRATPVVGQASPLFYRDLSEQLATLFEHSVTDIVEHHNQVLDVYRTAKAHDKLHGIGPLTFLHFDTHSDFIANNEDTETIASYVNAVIAKEEISDFYWVLPQATKRSGLYRVFWDPEQPTDLAMAKGPSHRRLYVDRRNRMTHIDPPPDAQTHPERYRTVNFHRVTASELPSLRNHRIWLDVDFDYFSNSGHDTVAAAEIHFEGHAGFESFVRTLTDKEIKPVLTTAAISPNYTPVEHQHQIERFFRDVGAHSKEDGLLITHRHESPGTRWGHGPGNQLLNSDPNFQLLDVMVRSDLMTTFPDGRMNLCYPTKESGRVDSHAMRIGLKPAELFAYMRKLDALDGKEDSSLDVRGLIRRLDRGEVSRKQLDDALEEAQGKRG